MTLSECVVAIALHFRTGQGRITNIAARLQDAGLVRKVEGSRRYPDDASPGEIVTLVLAVLAETSIGTADQSATTFAALQAPDGVRLDRAIHDVIFSQIDADIGIRLAPPGASLTVDNQTVVFGAPETEGVTTARFIPSSAIAALRDTINSKETA